MADRARLVVREPDAAERDWVQEQLHQLWGSATVVSRGQAYDTAQLPALMALAGERPVGVATFHVTGGECELVTLNAADRGQGIGSALLAGVVEAAARHGCWRLWLITSNDNLDAIRFYQRRGLRLVAVHSGGIDEARQLKPGIPEIGDYGIALHDELEFELALDTEAEFVTALKEEALGYDDGQR